MIQSQLSQRKKNQILILLNYLNRTLNSEYKLIYRYKISFFVFDIIEIEYEFDYRIFSEISPWAYFRVLSVVNF
jgi:hypothetical protein